MYNNQMVIVVYIIVKIYISNVDCDIFSPENMDNNRESNYTITNNNIVI